MWIFLCTFASDFTQMRQFLHIIILTIQSDKSGENQRPLIEYPPLPNRSGGCSIVITIRRDHRHPGRWR